MFPSNSDGVHQRMKVINFGEFIRELSSVMCCMTSRFLTAAWVKLVLMEIKILINYNTERTSHRATIRLIYMPIMA